MNCEICCEICKISFGYRDQIVGEICNHFEINQMSLFCVRCFYKYRFNKQAPCLICFYKHVSNNYSIFSYSYQNTIEDIRYIFSPQIDNSCIICKEEMKQYRGPQLTCNHNQFHYNCIKRWFERINSCPICRTLNLIDI